MLVIKYLLQNDGEILFPFKTHFDGPILMVGPSLKIWDPKPSQANKVVWQRSPCQGG
jgi:hypothetical protein